MSALPDIPDSIAEAIATGNTPHVLDATLQHFHCQAGTIHRMGPVGKLELIAHSGIPPEVVQIVEFVPLGKGIAGLAAERRAPVTICNLQSDTSGQARPGAKATGMWRAIRRHFVNALRGRTAAKSDWWWADIADDFPRAVEP